MYSKAVKTYIGKRQYAYVYILHKLFNGDVKEFCRAMRIHEIYPKDVQDWDAEFGYQVKHDMEEDAKLNAQLRDEDGDIPTVASIKDALLLKIKALISSTEDPSKLATCYRVLSEFGKDSARAATAKGAADVVMEHLEAKGKKQLQVNRKDRARNKKELAALKEQEELEALM